MAHNEQREFCMQVKKNFPQYFKNSTVLDIGSLDINGSNQALFETCVYFGVDIGDGRNVDIISKGHELALEGATFDVIISTECFEHDMYYKETLNNIYRMLKPGGLLIFTCATTGRPEHGTKRTETVQDAPLLSNFSEWSDYYKNLTEADIREVMDCEKLFSEFLFDTNIKSFDLYFCGIKNSVVENIAQNNGIIPNEVLFEKIRKRSHEYNKIREQENELGEKILEIQKKAEENRIKSQELTNIYNSKSWKVSQFMLNVARKLKVVK
ncbi:MAG: methyltransferase domain-containing protein [Fusobacteria bacterium]|nr:methyltransferase domain-containing protein [Fusobacteriota bacterium]